MRELNFSWNHVLPLRRLASYETPFLVAMLRALAMASAKLTDPELIGLILLRSRLPEVLGCGKG